MESFFRLCVRPEKCEDSVNEPHDFLVAAALCNPCGQPRVHAARTAHPQVPAGLRSDETNVFGRGFSALIRATAHRDLEFPRCGLAVMRRIDGSPNGEAILLATLAKVRSWADSHTAHALPRNGARLHPEILPNLFDVLLFQANQGNSLSAREFQGLTLVTLGDIGNLAKQFRRDHSARNVRSDSVRRAVALQHYALITIAQAQGRRTYRACRVRRVWVIHEQICSAY